MDKNSKFLLSKITPLHDIPQAGVYSIRENGKLLARNTDEEVNIVSKTDKEGIDVFVKSGTQNKSVHIPVLVSMSGFDDLVYNDFYIGDNCDILIVAGCGIHNPSEKKSSHNGIHTFHIGKNSKVKYVEKHFAFGNKKSKKILNPVTEIEVGENSTCEMETLQLGGVTFADRKTNAVLKDNAKLLIRENILTEEKEEAKTDFKVELKGKNSRVEVISRAVAKGSSVQEFNSVLIGENECFGHVECDGILSDKAVVSSTPTIVAKRKMQCLFTKLQLVKLVKNNKINL